MTEDTPKVPESEGIVVPELELPNREERRSMSRKGHDNQGNEVHPDSQRNLRNATIADIIAFGVEVNKANNTLNQKMESAFKQFGTEVDLRFTEVHWNFATFLNFMGTLGVLPEDFLTKFEEFKKKAEEEVKAAADEVLKKQKEAEALKNPGDVGEKKDADN